MGGLSDSKLDQSEDPELRIQQFIFLESDASLRLEKRIEVLDERRIEGQERSVERLVEILQFSLILLSGKMFLELIQISRTH